MHDMLAEKLLMFERLLLKHDYQELLLRTRPRQLHEKALRIIRLKEEQLQLLDDLIRETATAHSSIQGDLSGRFRPSQAAED